MSILVLAVFIKYHLTSECADGRRLMVDNRRVIVGRGNLLIRQLMPDDEGNYVCESTVGGRTLTSIPARLSVVGLWLSSNVSYFNCKM